MKTGNVTNAAGCTNEQLQASASLARRNVEALKERRAAGTVRRVARVAQGIKGHLYRGRAEVPVRTVCKLTHTLGGDALMRRID